MTDELIEGDFEPGPDLTLRQWARQINWGATSVSDCHGYDHDDETSGWALYDMDEDDPPIAEFALADDAFRVAQILREYAGQDDERRAAPESWLNGWPLLSSDATVLIGTAVHCAGCGRFGGIATVALSPGWVPPPNSPEWPFSKQRCPICYMRDHWEPRRDEASWPKGKPRPLP